MSLQIRLATERDVPTLLEIYAPYVRDTVVSFEYEVPSVEEFLGRFHTVTEKFPWLVCEVDGVIAGYAYASTAFGRKAWQWVADASVYLSADLYGMGIGRRLYEALMELLQLQGCQLLYGVISAENVRSIAFHRSMGFHEVGRFPQCGFKLGRWLDVVWMQRELGRFEENPAPPRAFPTLEAQAVHAVLERGSAR